MKDNVLKAVGSFFTSSKLLSEVNSTLITLVPKVPNPPKMREFRPISCCNIVYNYITKILDNRLKLCLADVIGPPKSAFIPGRSIAENILWAQEMMNVACCSIKLDLMKAYDLVDL